MIKLNNDDVVLLEEPWYYAKEIPNCHETGVYTIYDKDWLPLYVGQSVDVGNRVKTHLNPNALDRVIKRIVACGGNCHLDKQIAFYSYIQGHYNELKIDVQKCSIEELNTIEEQTITELQPLFNYQGIDVPFRPYQRKDDAATPKI